MKTCKVKLNAFGEILDFVNAASNFESAVDIVTGSHKINCKSLLGMMTLDLSNPVELRVHGEHPEKFVNAINAYLVA